MKIQWKGLSTGDFRGKLRQLLGEGPPTQPMTGLTALMVVVGLVLLELLLMVPVLELSNRLSAWPARAASVYVGGYVLFRLFIMLSVMAGDGYRQGAKEGPLKKPFGRLALEGAMAMALVAGFRFLYDLTLGAWLLEIFPENEALLEAFEFLMQSPVAAGIYVLVLSPVFEEFLYRGVLLRGLLFKGFSPAYAVVVSSLLFALVHLNLLQGIHAFLLGALLGVLYLKTGNFTVVVLGHFVSNLIVWLQGLG